MYTSPHFSDIAKAFIPEIKDEQIRNELLSVQTDSSEFLDLFDKYVFDDFEEKNMAKHGISFYSEKKIRLETARKFCNDNDIECEE